MARSRVLTAIHIVGGSVVSSRLGHHLRPAAGAAAADVELLEQAVELRLLRLLLAERVHLPLRTAGGAANDRRRRRRRAPAVRKGARRRAGARTADGRWRRPHTHTGTTHDTRFVGGLLLLHTETTRRIAHEIASSSSSRRTKPKRPVSRFEPVSVGGEARATATRLHRGTAWAGFCLIHQIISSRACTASGSHVSRRHVASISSSGARAEGASAASVAAASPAAHAASASPYSPSPYLGHHRPTRSDRFKLEHDGVAARASEVVGVFDRDDE